MGRAKYFEQFPVVELQETFYEPPSVELARKWRDDAPPGFRFCMKAWQLITHTAASPTYRRLKSKLGAEERDLVGAFRDTEQVWLAWERTRSIARAVRADIVVFQCPASFRPTGENVRNLRTFFERAADKEFRFAWEPRGAWPAELVRDVCDQFDLIHCVDPFVTESVYGNEIYWRLHGRKGYSYRYSDEELTALGEKLKQHEAGATGPAYVLFNNVWMKEDSIRFQAMLAERAQ
jgi:uncharacterized protein YecE (DUF72 family)